MVCEGRRKIISFSQKARTVYLDHRMHMCPSHLCQCPLSGLISLQMGMLLGDQTLRARLKRPCSPVGIFVCFQQGNGVSTYLKTENFDREGDFQRSHLHYILLIIRRTALTEQPVFHSELLPRYFFITPSFRAKDAFQTSNAVLGPVKLHTKKLSTESKKKMQFIIVIILSLDITRIENERKAHKNITRGQLVTQDIKQFCTAKYVKEK